MKPYYSFFLFLLSIIAFHAQKSALTKDLNEITTLLSKSRMLHLQKNFQQSLIVSDLVLNKSLEQKNDSLIAYAYDMYGRNFNELYGSDKSIESYKKGLVYAEKAKKTYVQRMFCNNIGNVLCFDKKQYAQGIYYYKKSLNFSSLNDPYPNYNSIIKANIAWAYFDWGKFQEGKSYLNEVTKNLEQLGSDYGDDENIMIVYLINGIYYSHQNEIALAKSYFEKAIAISKNEDYFNKVYLFEEYAKFLSKIGEDKKALDNYKNFHLLRQKIYKEKKIESTNISALQLQLQEYKKNIKISEQKNISQSEKLKNSKIIGILGLLLTGALLIALFQLKKTNRIEKENISKLEVINKELQKSNIKAEEASVLKSQFISTITHELRTPLYGVVGITDLLLSDHKNKKNEKTLDALKFSANYLMTLVNDVLQISEIEEAKPVLDEAFFNLSKIVSDLKNSLLYIAENNNATLEVVIDPNIPNQLFGDSQKLVQILMNLVTNALKFTPNGTVIIDIQISKIDAEKMFLEFRIIDDGIGISEENQSKIFDNFTQIKQEKQLFEGSGLGLFIVKRLIALFNSDIHLQSTFGKGSTFSFTIGFDNTVVNNPNTHGQFISNHLIPSEIKPLHLLIVDDNRINQLVTKKIIERENHSCEIVSNGKDAISILKKSPFDFVLMDINMPEMNGYETTKKIRKFDKNTKIVALTASVRDQITESALASGMNEVIIKPFLSDDFFKVIYKLL